MPMYLFHQQIIYFTIYWLNGKVNPYLHAGINFVAALVGSFIISSILMRWKVTRFLIGEKAWHQPYNIIIQAEKGGAPHWKRNTKFSSVQHILILQIGRAHV